LVFRSFSNMLPANLKRGKQNKLNCTFGPSRSKFSKWKVVIVQGWKNREKSVLHSDTAQFGSLSQTKPTKRNRFMKEANQLCINNLVDKRRSFSITRLIVDNTNVHRHLSLKIVWIPLTSNFAVQLFLPLLLSIFLPHRIISYDFEFHCYMQSCILSIHSSKPLKRRKLFDIKIRVLNTTKFNLFCCSIFCKRNKQQ